MRLIDASRATYRGKLKDPNYRRRDAENGHGPLAVGSGANSRSAHSGQNGRRFPTPSDQ
jgi:hypothetical protein